MSNLFRVDEDAVAKLLAEANAALAQRCEDLASALERMPAHLGSDDDVRRAEAYARQIKAALAELRRAKASDKAPFAKAGKVVDDFFARLSKPLDRALSAAERALDVARIQASQARDSDRVEKPIATGANSHVVMSAGEPSIAQDISAVVVSKLPTMWKASRIDREALDLEALRSLLTDTEMDRLVARWLKERGPQPLRGVTWVEVVKT